jgi:hypothetical protein
MGSCALYLWNITILFGYLSICNSWLNVQWLFNLCGKECVFSNREVGMFSLVGPYIPHSPRNLQDDFHHRGHIEHHLICLLVGIGFSSGHLCILRISVWDGNNFWYAHIFDSLHIEFGRFELYFAPLYVFYIEYVLVIWGRFQIGCLVL